MKQGLFSVVILAGVSSALCGGSFAWSQTTPAPGKNQTQTKASAGERSGEEKMEARGAQESGRMETKKGEGEMEARGAQKPGPMQKEGAASPGAKESQSERWAAQDVKKAQEALKNKGHDPGSMDGIMGPQTRQAIKAFQSANGLKATGRLDNETAQKLGVEKDNASGAPSSAGASKAQASPKEAPAPVRK